MGLGAGLVPCRCAAAPGYVAAEPGDGSGRPL